MKKAKTNPVEKTTIDCDRSGPRPAFSTKDSIDGLVMHAVRHEDDDVSIYIDFEGEDTREVVMTPEQAKEFFTLALTLC